MDEQTVFNALRELVLRGEVSIAQLGAVLIAIGQPLEVFSDEDLWGDFERALKSLPQEYRVHIRLLVMRRMRRAN